MYQESGVRLSAVFRLPEVLYLHRKLFRHELMVRAKVGAKNTFPLHDLNMAPYNHKGKSFYLLHKLWYCFSP